MAKLLPIEYLLEGSFHERQRNVSHARGRLYGTDVQLEYFLPTLNGVLSKYSEGEYHAMTASVDGKEFVYIGHNAILSTLHSYSKALVVSVRPGSLKHISAFVRQWGSCGCPGEVLGKYKKMDSVANIYVDPKNKFAIIEKSIWPALYKLKSKGDLAIGISYGLSI